MAKRLPQLAILAALAAGLVPLLALVLTSGGALGFDSSIIAIVLFTLKQAALSTLLSVIPGLAAARALMHLRFSGRSLLLTLFALPMAVPAIVAVLGATALIGNSGLLPELFPLYGLPGILFVHVFFNLPMATRLFYQALTEVRPESHKLAAQLGFGPVQVFAHVEWPAMKVVVPQVAGLIFLLCAASFVVVLTLGGASSTTLEVAIYQSLRMDFDPARALALSLIQIGVSAVLTGFAQASFRQDKGFAPLRTVTPQLTPEALGARAMNVCFVALAAFVVLPLLAVIVLAGVNHLHFTSATLGALFTSLGLGLASAVIALALAWPLSKAQDATSHVISLAGLIFPPAVLATGWFLLLHKLGDSLALTLAFIIALNSLMALPYAAASLRAGQMRLAPLARLQEQLGFAGLTRFSMIELPLLRRAAAQAFLMALVMSLGDLTAITLLGSSNIVTLPTLLHAEMGHYRSADASGTALLLLILCGLLTFAAQKLGERDAQP